MDASIEKVLGLENVCNTTKRICVILDTKYENWTLKIYAGSMPASNKRLPEISTSVTTKTKKNI